LKRVQHGRSRRAVALLAGPGVSPEKKSSLFKRMWYKIRERYKTFIESGILAKQDAIEHWIEECLMTNV
jgi:hypothetical protein